MVAQTQAQPELPDEELIAAANVQLPPAAKVTPMLRQWLSAKAKSPGSILLFRMGDFYELFACDAEEAAPILELALTSREKSKGKDGAIAMAGFPHHAAPAYIAKLIEAGLKVAVCDQLEDPALARGIVKRDVTRVVTPGMVLEESGLDAKSHNWLVAVAGPGPDWGLAALDVSTGAFLAGIAGGDQALLDEVSRLDPPELVVPEREGPHEALLHRLLNRGEGQPRRRAEQRPCPSARALAGRPKPGTALHQLDKTLDTWLNEKPQKAAKVAAELAAGYVLETQGQVPSHLRAPRPFRPDRLLLLDATTRNHLALCGPTGATRKPGTLAHVVDKTKTAPGGRRLMSLLLAPSTDLGVIRERHEVVGAFVGDPGTREKVREALTGVYDVERLCARASSGRANPRELGQLRDSLMRVPAVLEALLDSPCEPLQKLAAGIDAQHEIAEHLDEALVDKPPTALGGDPVFKASFDADLAEAAQLAAGGQDAIAQVEQSEREKTGIPNLKVKYTRVFGYYLEVTKTHLSKVPEHYRRKQTVANAERFITEELTALEEKVAHAQQQSREREAALFEELRKGVAEAAIPLLDMAEALAHVDAMAAFAEVADKGGWTRPSLLGPDARRLKIEDGRHPIVEEALRATGEVFVPSSVELSGDERQVLLVTGPNMAGKSTMMRQVALVQILAQAGSFVPASSAELSICDRIFTRVGASDDLAEGRSTFMVEMTETAHILKNATPRSLLLLDEIGRGTATYDGLSLAWSVAEYLHDEVGARTLFATHYHELCDLSLSLERLKNVHVVVKEWNDQIIFTRTLAEGGAERSYGIQVARLAGLPAAVLARARAVLAELEGDAVVEDDQIMRSSLPLKLKRKKKKDQMDLFGQNAEEAPKDPWAELIDQIVDIDVNRLSPIAALNRLDELVRATKRQRREVRSDD